jgi:hypothetical protein
MSAAPNYVIFQFTIEKVRYKPSHHLRTRFATSDGRRLERIKHFASDSSAAANRS